MKSRRILVVLIALGAVAAGAVAGWNHVGRWRVPEPDDSVHIAVFMLHRVMPGKTGDYVMTPESLDRFLTGLTRRRFTPITLGQLEAALTRNGPLPRRPAMLTFDDAYQDNYVHAFPLLRKHGWPAVFFVPTGKISDSPDQRVAWGDDTNPVGMTWDELREVAAAGIELGSHSVNHPNLKKADDETLARELTESRATLEAKLGISVRALAYPGGRNDERVRAAAAKAGYTMAFRSDGGPITMPPPELLRLRRVPLLGFQDPEDVLRSVPQCQWN